MLHFATTNGVQIAHSSFGVHGTRSLVFLLLGKGTDLPGKGTDQSLLANRGTGQEGQTEGQVNDYWGLANRGTGQFANRRTG